ncbi:hypothetical protein ABVT39_023383 [Epinephelus coioides]
MDLFQQVLQISRIGGRNTKNYVHKVLDRVFTNSLMAKFNLKGKGKRGKRPLEGTKVYRAIQEGVMKFNSAATEEYIKTFGRRRKKTSPGVTKQPLQCTEIGRPKMTSKRRHSNVTLRTGLSISHALSTYLTCLLEKQALLYQVGINMSVIVFGFRN